MGRPSTEKITIGGIIAGLAILSWLIIIFGPNSPMAGAFDSIGFLLFVGVWAVGMVAMMLPSLLPMIFLVVSSSRRITETGDLSTLGRRVSQPVFFVLGYFGVWSLVGVAAYVGLTFLFRTYSPFAMSGQLAGLAAAAAVFLAGVYQFSPLKQKALEACRSPMNFVMTRWRGSSFGGLLMGLDYGFFCTKCCWAFMAVLLVVGAMNLLWMVAFAGVIFVEKIAPRGVMVSRGLGVVLMAGGVVLAILPTS